MYQCQSSSLFLLLSVWKKEHFVKLMPVHMKYDIGRLWLLRNRRDPFQIAAAIDIQMMMNVHQKSSLKIDGFFK